jgi:hypothetical protein
VRDVIDYDAGFGWAGTVAEKIFLSRHMQRTFAYRQHILGSLLSETGY